MNQDVPSRPHIVVAEVPLSQASRCYRLDSWYLYAQLNIGLSDSGGSAVCSFPLCFGPKLRKNADTNFDKRVYVSKIYVTEFGSKQWAIISRQAMVSNRIIMTQILGTGSRHISDRKPLKKETCIFYSGETTERKRYESTSRRANPS